MKFEFLDIEMDDCAPDKAPTFFGFSCPKHPERMCTGLVIRGNPDGLKPENATWAWNGSREAPTFSPSINCEHCSHGYIEDGNWRDA